MNLQVCALSLMAFCASAADVAARAAQPGAEPCEYMYFKEPRALAVDAGWIAVFHGAGDGHAAAAAVAAAGLDAAGWEPLGIDGWRLVRVGPLRDVRLLVDRLARDQRIAFVSPVLLTAEGGRAVVPREILVGFERDLNEGRVQAVLADWDGGVVLERDWGAMANAFRLRADARDGFAVLEAANRLARCPEVVFAEPDMIFTGRGDFIPNDPGFGTCWGVHNVGQSGGVADMDMDGPEAWDITLGDASVVVVVLDTGVQQDHPDINQRPGTDTTGQNGGGAPVNGCDNHGTPVAGCVSAHIDNALGTVGIAGGCLSASARTFVSTLSCDGSWTSQASWTVSSLAWAESIGARVTNNSNGYGFSSSSIAQKYRDTRDAGIVHFASAGNTSGPGLTYPGSLATVNAVAALNRQGSRAPFSSYGPGLDFSAPGVSVYSTDRTGSAGYDSGDYASVNGTSFASPYTAGVAALVLSVNPSLSPGDVEAILQGSCVDRGAPGYDTGYGWGLVNAAGAVAAARPCPADWTGDGAVTSDDFFVFLADFLGASGADFNRDGATDSDDYFAFLTAFFEGC